MEDEDDDDDEPTTVPSLLLDIGAGSGLSGEILTDEGHHWVGCDISGDMLGTPTHALHRTWVSC